MARRPRNATGGVIYHVLNRGNCKMRIFDKPGDYFAFLKVLEQARERTGMRILGYCLMPNHWHLILWPVADGDLSKFVGWVSTTHVRRWREHRDSAGEGHLYQGRFKSFPVEDDQHLLTVLRYVEANPLRAKKVKRAEAWEWSSLRDPKAAGPAPVALARWPVDRPRAWIETVNEVIAKPALDEIRLAVARGRPFGSKDWIRKTALKLGLESTMRDPWRPTKTKA
jgi:putative transposase